MHLCNNFKMVCVRSIPLNNWKFKSRNCICYVGITCQSYKEYFLSIMDYKQTIYLQWEDIFFCFWLQRFLYLIKPFSGITFKIFLTILIFITALIFHLFVFGGCLKLSSKVPFPVVHLHIFPTLEVAQFTKQFCIYSRHN